ncbi:hypothetical protein ABH935_006739 [Catenulispora sp. GAS73]|uniref:hypothetical protein n=1 Tax=Catenulispora sp. GAS73 TaxID=3156269 RepID=UPI003514AAC6
MESVYEYRALLACDIASSAGRGENNLQEIRGVLEAACSAAFRTAGLDWAGCRRQDTGDGFQLVAPSGIRKQTLLHPVLPDLATRVRAHNRRAPAKVQIRLRVALHAGEIKLDPDGGFSGAPFEILARLLNAAPVRAALSGAPEGVPVAAILSQHYGEETIGSGYDAGPDADAFVPVEVREKAYVGRAWIHCPGSPIGPQSAAACLAEHTEARRTAEVAVQKNTASGHGRVFAVQSGTMQVDSREGTV